MSKNTLNLVICLTKLVELKMIFTGMPVLLRIKCGEYFYISGITKISSKGCLQTKPTSLA